jgi:hypothetical protein
MTPALCALDARPGAISNGMGDGGFSWANEALLASDTHPCGDHRSGIGDVDAACRDPQVTAAVVEGAVIAMVDVKRAIIPEDRPMHPDGRVRPILSPDIPHGVDAAATTVRLCLPAIDAQLVEYVVVDDREPMLPDRMAAPQLDLAHGIFRFARGGRRWKP